VELLLLGIAESATLTGQLPEGRQHIPEGRHTTGFHLFTHDTTFRYRTRPGGGKRSHPRLSCHSGSDPATNRLTLHLMNTGIDFTCRGF